MVHRSRSLLALALAHSAQASQACVTIKAFPSIPFMENSETTSPSTVANQDVEYSDLQHPVVPHQIYSQLLGGV